MGSSELAAAYFGSDRWGKMEGRSTSDGGMNVGRAVGKEHAFGPNADLLSSVLDLDAVTLATGSGFSRKHPVNHYYTAM